MKSAFSRFFGGGAKTVEVQEASATEKVQEIELSSIEPNRYQPRTIFDDAKIEELAQTIEAHGVIQPIVVRKNDGEGYEIIAGERRYRAMKSLGWGKVPAIVRDMNDKDMASVALIENLQREELTSIEEAQAYAKLLDLHNLTQDALAKRLGKSQSTVANKLRLLKLPEEVQQSILKREITERHARALLTVKEKDTQLMLLAEMLESNYNVRELEQRIQMLLTPEEEPQKKTRKKQKMVSRDVRIALNTIRESVSMVTKAGIEAKTDEEEFEEYYQVTIKIPKNKK